MRNKRLYPLQLTLLLILVAVCKLAEAGLIVPPQNRWPDGLIPYQLDSGMSAIATEKTMRAINREYHLRTAVRFVRRTPDNAHLFPNYKVIMLDPAAPFSNAGSIGVANGATIVRFASNVELPPVNGGLDFGQRTIIHELGHVAGLYHEDARLDMWDYFTIDWSQVIDPQCPYQRETSLAGIPIGPFDYFSVMDGIPPFCAVNELGGPSLHYLDPIDPEVSWQDLRGRLDDALSTGDVTAIEAIYGPKPQPLDLGSNLLAPFAGQDAGVAEILNDGATLSLSGAEWQATGVEFSITSASVLDFDFSSTSQGDIHAIGLAAGDSAVPENFFQLYGSANWANRDYAYTGGGNPQHFSIYLGDRYAGTTMRLVFINSPASGTSNADSVFSNVVLSKGVTIKPTLAIASPLPGAQYQKTDTITLSASVTDVADGSLDGQIRWQSSINGFLGQGASLNVNLSIGAHVITASVSYPDGTLAQKQVNINVTAVNKAPTILILSPCDQCSGSVIYPVTFSVHATDAEDGNLSSQVRLTSSIDGVITSPARLSAGTHIITASVTDSGGLSAAKSITLTMRPNAAPTVLILSPSDQSNFSVNNNPIAFSVYANDAEQGNLSSQVRLTSSIDGVITSPANLSAGTHIITASVTDSGGLSAAKSITLTMRPNAAPAVLILSPADQSNFSVNNNPVVFTVSATDAEDGNLGSQVRLTSSIDGIITSPANLSAGTHVITASITDSGGLSANASITLTMRPNAPPQLSISSPLNGQTLLQALAVTLAAQATDAEDGNISSAITWRSSIDGAIVSPALLSSGIHILTATVTDSRGLSASATVQVTVVNPSYCTSRGNNAASEWVANVRLAGVNQTSGSNGGYRDATAIIMNAPRGVGIPLVLSPGYSSSTLTESWAFWIDFNRDGQFASSERVYAGSGKTARNATITIPSGTAPGQTRMRVSMKRGTSVPQSCETFSRGEVEDYTINIQP